MTVPPTQLREFLDGHWGWARDLVREQAEDPLFHPVVGLDTESYRQRVLEQMHAAARADVPKYLFPTDYGGSTTPVRRSRPSRPSGAATCRSW